MFKNAKIPPIKEVTTYLELNASDFLDKAMVQITQTRDDYILAEMSKVAIKIGVYVDEERLKKWIDMCSALENIPVDMCVDIALKAKIKRLESYVHILEQKLDLVREENRNLKELIGDYD